MAYGDDRDLEMVQDFVEDQLQKGGVVPPVRHSITCEVEAEQRGGVVDPSVEIHRYVDYTIIEFPGAALALRVAGRDSVRLPPPLGWEIRA